MAKTTAQILLFKHGITLQEISDRCGVHRLTVRRALDPQHFATVSHKTVVQARTALEAILKERGKAPPDGLWAEYDNLFEAPKAA